MVTAPRTPRRLPRLATILIVIALVVPVAHVATANGPTEIGPVYAWKQVWQEFTVHVGDTVLLGARYGACVPGLAWSARNALSYDYSLDGEPLAFDFAWDRPVAVPYHTETGTCMAGPDDGQLWWIYAEYPIVFDEPGDYEIGAVVSSSRPLIDGGDWDGDGFIDRLDRGVAAEGTSTVHVLP